MLSLHVAWRAARCRVPTPIVSDLCVGQARGWHLRLPLRVCLGVFLTILYRKGEREYVDV